MSWKLKLKQKRFDLTLLLLLIVSLAFNAYGYYSIKTQSSGNFNIQLSADTELKLQLDSFTYMIIHSQTAFNGSGYWLRTTDTTGDLQFETVGTPTLNFYWLGNVSNVQFGRVDIGLAPITNATDHVLADAKTYRLTWDWLTHSPPPSDYFYQVTSYDENVTLPFTGLPFTITVNSSSTSYTTTQMGYLAAGNEYRFDFPSVYEYNENYSLVFNKVSVWNGVSSYDVPYPSVTITPTADIALTVYYTEGPPGVMLPLLPITFIIGMVGLGCLFVGPLYAVVLFRKKDYRNALVWGVILTAMGFALFISWLWH